MKVRIIIAMFFMLFSHNLMAEYNKLLDREVLTIDSKGNAIKTTIAKEAGSGKVILVKFWASWCPQCMAEMPSALQMKKDLADENFRVIYLSEESNSIDYLNNFIARKKLPLKPYIDIDNQIFTELDMEGVPMSALFSSKGKLEFIVDGGTDWQDQDIRDKIRSYIKESHAK